MSQRSKTCPFDMDGALEYFGDFTRKVKMQNLYETVPTLNDVDLSELIDKKAVPIIADKTAGGFTFNGTFEIIADPTEGQGGTTFALFQHNVDEGVLWANQGNTIAGKKFSGAPDYGIVVVMGQDSHQSNATVSQHYMSAVMNALETGKLDSAKLKELSQFVRENAYQGKDNPFEDLQNMPDMDSPEFKPWLQNELGSFEDTKRLMELLSRSEIKDLDVLPNLDAILENTRDVHQDGLDWGSSALLVKFDREGSMNADGSPRTLESYGVPPHKSYKYGIKGTVVGKFGRPIHWTSMFDGFTEAFLYGGNPEYTAYGQPRVGVRNELKPIYKKDEKGKLIRDSEGNKIESGEFINKGGDLTDQEIIGSSGRRSFELTMPTTSFTKERIDIAKQNPFKAIKSQEQLRDVVNAGVGNFIDKKVPANQKGISTSVAIDNIKFSNARGIHEINPEDVMILSKTKDGKRSYKWKPNINIHGLPIGGSGAGASNPKAMFAIVDTDTQTITGVVNNKRNNEYLTPVLILNAVDNGARHIEFDEFSVTTNTLLNRLGFRRVDNGQGKVRYSIADNGELDGNRVQQYFDQGLRGLSLEDAKQYVANRDRGLGERHKLLDKLFGQGTAYLGNKGNEGGSRDLFRQQSLANTLLETSLMSPEEAGQINVDPALIQQAQQRTGLLNE